jgi:hypothetical protein
MTASRRLYALALACVFAVTALLFTGARAWATAHGSDARCSRPAATAPVGHRPAVNRSEPGSGQGLAPGSWRAHTLRVAGCGAWRQMHGRMHHRQH